MLAEIMHRLSTAVPQSSTLTALCFLGLLSVLQEYACGAHRRTPCHRSACGTSLRKPMHNPGLSVKLGPLCYSSLLLFFF